MIIATHVHLWKNLIKTLLQITLFSWKQPSFSYPKIVLSKVIYSWDVKKHLNQLLIIMKAATIWCSNNWKSSVNSQLISVCNCSKSMDNLFINVLIQLYQTIGSWHQLNSRQETPQCDENQVFNDSTKYLCDRKKKWKMAMMKNDVSILVALVACTKFSVNRPKQTKVIEQKLNFYT